MVALRLAEKSGLLAAFSENLPESEPIQLMGLTFPNRLGLAAGLDKNGVAPWAWWAFGFGFVELGTVTPRPQAGNPRPRIFRLPADEGVM